MIPALRATWMSPWDRRTRFADRSGWWRRVGGEPYLRRSRSGCASSGRRSPPYQWRLWCAVSAVVEFSELCIDW